MYFEEILQTSGNSLPTRLQAIMQPGSCWQTPCLPRCLNPLKGETISDSMMFKAGLMRKGLALREVDIAVDEDHDWNLAIPPLTGEVPKEWADGWWLEKTEKTKCPVRPFISNLMLGFDDDDEDIYG